MKRWLPGLLVGAVLGALAAAGLLVSSQIYHRLEYGPDPETIAQNSLRAVQRQQTMVVLAARFTAVVTSQQTRFGGVLSAQKTLMVPGTVRYEIDWAKVTPGLTALGCSVEDTGGDAARAGYRWARNRSEVDAGV